MVGSIWLLGIRSTVLLIQIALLNGCERLLKYLAVLVGLGGVSAKTFLSLSLTHIKPVVLPLRCINIWGKTDKISCVYYYHAKCIELIQPKGTWSMFESY